MIWSRESIIKKKKKQRPSVYKGKSETAKISTLARNESILTLLHTMDFPDPQQINYNTTALCPFLYRVREK